MREPSPIGLGDPYAGCRLDVPFSPKSAVHRIAQCLRGRAGDSTSGRDSEDAGRNTRVTVHFTVTPLMPSGSAQAFGVSLLGGRGAAENPSLS